MASFPCFHCWHRICLYILLVSNQAMGTFVSYSRSQCPFSINLNLDLILEFGGVQFRKMMHCSQSSIPLEILEVKNMRPETRPHQTFGNMPCLIPRKSAHKKTKTFKLITDVADVIRSIVCAGYPRFKMNYEKESVFHLDVWQRVDETPV